MYCILQSFLTLMCPYGLCNISLVNFTLKRQFETGDLGPVYKEGGRVTLASALTLASRQKIVWVDRYGNHMLETHERDSA